MADHGSCHVAAPVFDIYRYGSLRVFKKIAMVIKSGINTTFSGILTTLASPDADIMG